MKHITHILVAVFFVLVFPRLITAQSKNPPTIEWEKCFGGIQFDDAKSIQQTTEGGYIVAGYSNSSSGSADGQYDYWILKLTIKGEIEWQKSLGGSMDDLAMSIQQTTDGGYIVAGNSYSNDGDVTGHHGYQDSSDYWIVKLTSTGVIEWQKSLGGRNSDEAYSIQQTTEGGYIVAGISYSSDGDVTGHHNYSDYWIVKLTSTGVIEWQKCLGGNRDDEARSIQQTVDGGYIVAGYSLSINGDVTGHYGSKDTADYWIVKLTSAGEIKWEKSIGGIHVEEAYSIDNTSDGGYIVSGRDGNFDCWIVKLDDSGGIQWQKVFGGSGYDFPRSIQQTTDGGYIVAGTSGSSDGDVTGNHGVSDQWVVKLTSTGDLQWQKSLGGSFWDEAFCTQQTTDGGYIIAGFSYSNDGDVTGNHGYSDYWIVKLSPENPSSVESESPTSQTATITPNPASTSATLTLESVEAGACEVQIISLTGATLKEYSTRLTIGKQDIALSGLESLPSGMYEVLVKRSGHQTLRTKFIVQ